MLGKLLLIAALIGVAYAEEDNFRGTMCDPDPKLGCYSNSAPFDHLPVPKSSADIGTKFYLYVRGYSSSQTLNYNSPSTISGSRFNGNKDTKIICHGFNSDSSSQWMHDMKNQFLIKGDFNVILVDWGGGAKTINYDQASANTRVVGDQIGELVKALPTSKSRVHITGHSLGSHISGYASRRAGIVGRISGLDPADPNFQGRSTTVKLDKYDASFVDVIHTDADVFLGGAGYGTKDASGHLDFWPNGGEDQPKCSWFKDHTRGIQKGGIGCDHGMAHTYYVESINSGCNFYGYPCANWNDFKGGKCYNCLGNPCPIMGYRASEFKNYNYNSQKLFLKTDDSAPYCLTSYRITVQTGMLRFAGTDSNVFVSLNGKYGESETFKFNNAGRHRGAIDKYMIESAKNIGEIESINVWQDDTAYAFGAWNLNNVLVMYEGKSLHFCANKWVSGGEVVRLYKC